MNTPANATHRLNLRSIRSALRSIHSVLALGFVTLLFLIWLIGSIGQWELQQLRIRARDSAEAYSSRLELVTNVRAAASNVIAQARLYRSARELGGRTFPYRYNLKQAKSELEKLLIEGKQLWVEKQEGLPEEEAKAWRQIESATINLFNKLSEEEKLQPQKLEESGTNDIGINLAQTTISQTDGIYQATDVDFYKIRNEMNDAVSNLSKIIVEGRSRAFNEINDLQSKAASDVGRATWLTFLFGVLTAVFIHWFTQKQLTKTRDAERRAEEEQGRKVAVFDSLSDDIVVLGENGEVLEVNQAFLNHFKVTNAELKQQNYHDALLQVPEISSFVGQTLRATHFDQRQRERIEVKSRNGQMGASLFDVSVSPLKVGDETHGRVVVMDDVTKDEIIREELRRSRTLSAVGQITAQVAHEIYNPLGAVKLNLDLLEIQTGGDEDVKHTIARLKRGVEHLSTIVMELRYLTRPREPERKPTDLNRLLDEIMELASDRLERSRICMVRDYSPEVPSGQFDPQQLRKVFLNLLINAVEASPQNGEVKMRTLFIQDPEVGAIHDINAPRGLIAVSVIDHGIGMSSETKRRLFEAFYTTKRNGTGLGMMITQEIVKKHGGKIEVESEEGEGTTVNVYLPV